MGVHFPQSTGNNWALRAAPHTRGCCWGCTPCLAPRLGSGPECREQSPHSDLGAWVPGRGSGRDISLQSWKGLVSGSPPTPATGAKSPEWAWKASAPRSPRLRVPVSLQGCPQALVLPTVSSHLSVATGQPPTASKMCSRGWESRFSITPGRGAVGSHPPPQTPTATETCGGTTLKGKARPSWPTLVETEGPGKSPALWEIPRNTADLNRGAKWGAADPKAGCVSP